ncbi:ATP-binding protein [Yoonia sp.]|uniref:sensor histidine kinase n=1 Tax=Yoonia sp. TaxID=2212373 RepID=UPI0035C85934
MAFAGFSSADQFAGSAFRRIRLAVAILALLVLSAGGYLLLNSSFQAEKIRETPARAQFFADAIDSALSRLAHLPYVLSLDPGTVAALQTEDVAELNPTFATIAARSGAEFVFLMDTNGRTIASSNYQDANSLVGRYYTFRPYFRSAMQGEQGRFYAVGATTGRPGYFIAEPVRDEAGTILGVIVVKVPFRDLSRAIVDSGDLILVTNAQGVVLAASEPAFLYGLIAPLSQQDRATLEQQQQFGNQVLTPLDWRESDGTQAQVSGAYYLLSRASLTQEDWTLHLLSNVGEIRRQALLFVAIGLTALLSLMIAAALYRASQLRQALAISNADRKRLETEIHDRHIAEEKLESARSELARKNQLAALGQLSASITHELGQPISAMKNYLVAEEIARAAVPGSYAPELTGLVDRMQRIVDQLRLFGRNDPAQTGQFVIQQAINDAVALVRHTAAQAGAQITVALAPDPLRTQGQANRFEQVIVNLLRNAVDAVAGAPTREITLRLTDADDVLIEVADSGTGLGGLDMDDLKEPFFSTKPSGAGMGLGLAISAQIINEMGGTLDARTAATGGAIFCIRLPKVP